MDKPESSLPKPFGKLIPQPKWQHIFGKIIEMSPDLNLYDGIQDISSRLLEIHRLKKKDNLLIIDEMIPNIAGEFIAKERELLVRAQYYEGGLNHRVSFYVRVLKKVIFKDFPALLISVTSPLRRVSNLYVAYPTEDKPVYLEIPVEGAPPIIRVIEMNLHKMKAYTPNATKLMPKSSQVDGIRIDFVDLGNTLIAGKVSAKDKETVEVDLEPLSDDAGRIFDDYLEDEYSKIHNPKPEHKKEDAARQKISTGEYSALKDAVPRAAVIIKDDILKTQVIAILKSFDWKHCAYEDFSEPDSNAFKDANLLILDVQQGVCHATDLIRNLIDRNEILPIRFVLFGLSPLEARAEKWEGLGEGLFIPSNAPYLWIKQKLAKWLNVSEYAGTVDKSKSQPLILVADDNLAMLDTLGVLLTRHNYKVITASNGREALQLSRRALPDLILLDINMPVISGFDVLQTLRSFQITRKIPVIVVTGYGEPEKVRRALSYNISGYIVKPFNDADLLQRVESVLRPEITVAKIGEKPPA